MRLLVKMKTSKRVRVADTLDIQAGGIICYVYKATAVAIATTGPIKRQARKRTTPANQDRQDKFNLRVPEPIPETFLDLMKYTKERKSEIRRFEAENAKYVQFANSKGLNFPSSIANQDAGLTNGWRQMTAAEEAAEKEMFSALYDEYTKQ